MRCQRCGVGLEESAKACPECGACEEVSNTILDRLVKIEEALLSTLLGLMVILVLIQLVLRNVFHTGIIGGDSIVKHLLLWIVFVGAGLAAKEGSHIRIDVALKILPEKWRQLVETTVTIFSVLICCVIVYASCYFVYMEYEGQERLPFYDIPLWIIEMIIPIGYSVIALRFAASGLSNIIKLSKAK
ncbi:MAG: TRAP transporter small permease subunit [Spirochaetota bacterium]|nr:TRAP transporter small permease subunit [Spirochaetota bacterium]